MNLVLEEANERIKMPLRGMFNPIVRPRVSGAAGRGERRWKCKSLHVRGHLAYCWVDRQPDSDTTANRGFIPSPLDAPHPLLCLTACALRRGRPRYAVVALRVARAAGAGLPVRAHLRQHARVGRAAGRRDRAVGLPRAHQGPQDRCVGGGHEQFIFIYQDKRARQRLWELC